VFLEIGANLCQSVDKNANVAKGTKGAKDKNHRLHRLAQICSAESVVFNHSIGVNLCQSVDKNAKGTKDTKDAKKKFSVFSLNFCVFCGFLLQSVQICVNRWMRTTD